MTEPIHISHLMRYVTEDAEDEDTEQLLQTKIEEITGKINRLTTNIERNQTAIKRLYEQLQNNDYQCYTAVTDELKLIFQAHYEKIIASSIRTETKEVLKGIFTETGCNDARFILAKSTHRTKPVST